MDALKEAIRIVEKEIEDLQALAAALRKLWRPVVAESEPLHDMTTSAPAKPGQPVPAVLQPRPTPPVFSSPAAAARILAPVERPGDCMKGNETEQPPRPPIPDGHYSDGDNKRATCTSETGITIGRSLRDPFTPTDLEARLDGQGRQRAYEWIAGWKRKSWIETGGFGQYRKTEKFGTWNNGNR